MITRIEVDGFKSLRGFSVDLEPLTAIVGPNGVGKSNLFDALQLLRDLADTDVVTALARGEAIVWISSLAPRTAIRLESRSPPTFF